MTKLVMPAWRSRMPAPIPPRPAPMMAIRTCPGSDPAAPAAAPASACPEAATLASADPEADDPEADDPAADDPEAACPEAACREAACPARNGGVEMPVTRYRRDGSGSDSSHGAEPSGVVSTPDPLREPSNSSSPSCAPIRPYQ